MIPTSTIYVISNLCSSVNSATGDRHADSRIAKDRIPETNERDGWREGVQMITNLSLHLYRHPGGRHAAPLVPANHGAALIIFKYNSLPGAIP